MPRIQPAVDPFAPPIRNSCGGACLERHFVVDSCMHFRNGEGELSTWPDGSHNRSRPSLALITIAVWTAFGLVESAKAYVALRMQHVPRGFGFALVQNMPWWYTWLLLTPVVFWVAKRAPLDQRQWKRSVAIHAIAGLVVSIVHLAIEGSIFFATRPTAVANFPGAPQSAWDQIVMFFHGYLMTNLLTYWAVVGGHAAWEYQHRFRQSALQSARLEAHGAQLALGLAEARMHALRMELNPHFLFNTLNAISGLVRKQESQAAVDMIARLGDLLRTTLDQELPPVIPVAAEVILLQQYLDIERVRFGARLTVNVTVDPDASNALVPTLLLQPLVENAIRYGVSARTGDARIDIGIWRDADRVHIEVQDSGDGLTNTRNASLKEGIGLGNSRARLHALYGESATLSLRNAPGGGACAEVSMPFHAATSENHDLAIA